MKASLLTAGAFAFALATPSIANELSGAQKATTPTNQQRDPRQLTVPTKESQLDTRERDHKATLTKKELAAQQQAASQTGGTVGSARTAGQGQGTQQFVASGSDTCTVPTPISGPGPFGFDANLMTTGTQGQAEASCLFFGQTGIENDAWFKWTSGFSGMAVVSFCGTSSGDSKVAVYNGTTCPAGSAIACNDDSCGLQSQLAFPATTAVIYTVQVGMYPGTAAIPTGTFAITAAPAGPANDLCANATNVSGPGPHAFDNTNSFLDGPNNCGIFTTDVWYNWTAGASGAFDVTTCGQTALDSQISVYATSACQGAHLGCNDQACASNQSEVTFLATIGNVYKIQLGGWNGGTGSGTFSVNAAPPPPANDLCAAATAIAGPGPHALNTVGALTDGPSNCGIMTNDTWYNWTSGTTAAMELNLCGGGLTFDPVVTVYDTTACQGTMLACNDDFCGLESKATFPATSGAIYKLQIGGYNGAEGTGTFQVIPAPPPPANDLCANATNVAGVGPHAWDNTSALLDGPNNCGIFTGDVWYNWTAGSTNTYRVSTCGQTSVDTQISVYQSAACQGAHLGCNDQACASNASQVDFPATVGNVYKIQLGGWNGSVGTGTFTVDLPPPPPANDGCSAPTLIAGAGPHNFDNTAATTGVEGQTEALCLAFGSTTVDLDQWFKWTAGSTGLASLSTCGTTAVDTKVGAYPGTPNCPTAGTALACNDDSCGLQSEICWNVTSGQSYIIQLGVFPGAAGGPGTFSINVGAAANPCQADDGSSEDALGFTAGGEIAWIQRFGGVGVTQVTNVQVSWGTPAFPGGAPGNGSPVKVLLYDDPNDDGDPTDAVLIQQVNTTVANVDTDILNVIPVTPVAMNGIFFAGAGEIHSAGQFVAPMDTTSSTCVTRSYLFGDNSGAAVNYVTPSANPFPPQSFASVGFSCNLMVRAGCVTSPMVANCFPGTGTTIPCPCGQPANASGGCANFGPTATSGATITASGTASLAADTLILTTANHRTAPAAGILNVFFASTGTTIPNGVANGAGVRCYNQVLKRLYTGQTNPPASGSLSKPGMGDPSVSARSAALSSPISAGQTRHYFNLYRDQQATAPAACNNTTSNVNVTNAGSVLWTP